MIESTIDTVEVQKDKTSKKKKKIRFHLEQSENPDD
jgi:hypothetical protein